MLFSLQQFFQAILPSEGVFVAAYLEDGKVKQKALKSPYGLEVFCESFQGVATDCWFATASYAQGWHEVETRTGVKHKLRTHDNAVSAKALWLDIDVGENKPYKTREQANAALVAFIRELGLPKPWVINSGKAGRHLYFEFDESVSKEDWQYLADRLKQACKQKGIHADPARTADISSIMRVPFTWNMKGVADGGQAHQVEIAAVGTPASYDTYKQILEPFTPMVDRTNRMPTITIPDLSGISTSALHSLQTLNTQEVLAKYFAPIKADFPTRPAIEVLRGCPQMRNQIGAEEPVWRGMLATMRHCENGRYVAHKISACDPRYNAADTDAKLDYLEDNEIPPYTCATFEALRPEVCKGCPYRGIVKSPISVPKQQKVIPIQPVSVAPEQTPEPVAQADEPVTQADEPAPVEEPVEVKQFDFADIDTENSKVNERGCFVRLKSPDGDYYWKQVHPYPVYPLQRVRGRTAKGETTISYIFRKYRINGFDDIQIEGATLMGQNLNAALGNYGFLLNDKEKKWMAGLLIDILKETEGTIGEVQTTDRLGWNNTYDTFLLGNKLYKTDGKVFEIAVAGKAKPFSDITVPQGSLDVWKQIANVYNKDGLEWGQAVMATAFASPLMPLGALEKAALLFVTGEKGVGKSTALLLASSVYGSPERLMFNKMDTPNSRFHKLGIYSNITAAFDEMTDLSPREASEFAYTLTQGRGKDKMSSGGEDMLLNTTYWSCLPVMSANDSIISALSQHSADPTAQMSRVLEIKAADINRFYTPEEVEMNERLVRQLPHNYGAAGDKYIHYITTHKAEVMEHIYQIEKRFKSYAGLNSNYRFWTYMCTRMIVGTMIAKQLGLVQYNVAKLFAYLVRVVQQAKRDIDKYRWTPENVVSQFLTANIPHRLVVKSASRGDGVPDDETRGTLNDINYVVQHPAAGRELTMRVELDTGDCIISQAAIKDWCKRGGIAYSEFIKHMETQYEVINRRARRDLGKQTVYRGAGAIDSIVVRVPTEMIKEV